MKFLKNMVYSYLKMPNSNTVIALNFGGFRKMY